MAEHACNPQTPIKNLHDDSRSDEELLHVALTEEDEDRAWDAIAVLHLRGNPATCEAARRLCASQDANERRVGADILGQLGKTDNKFHEEAVTTLLGMLEREQDPDVLNSIGAALGHRHDPRAIEPLAHLKHHPEWQVRFSVAHGLWGFEDERAITTLLELSTDPDEVIRDWATTGLGSTIDADTPEIRAALMARLVDEDEVTRREAMVGLARRHDRRVVEPLLAELETGGYESLLFEAAEQIGDPRLYPALIRLREEWEGERGENWLYRQLEDAIAACQPRRET